MYGSCFHFLYSFFKQAPHKQLRLYLVFLQSAEVRRSFYASLFFAVLVTMGIVSLLFSAGLKGLRPSQGLLNLMAPASVLVCTSVDSSADIYCCIMYYYNYWLVVFFCNRIFLTMMNSMCTIIN